jgi:antitoxin (DNA-binding transcriptional repressor) of toxin-antitoxin stability system
MIHDRELTLTVSAFKAQCLDVMARIASHKLSRVTVTKRGKPIAVMGPVEQVLDGKSLCKGNQGYAKSWGAMRRTLDIPVDFDWQELENVAMPEPDTADLMEQLCGRRPDS